MPLLIAARFWPDAIDWSAILVYFGLLVVVPSVGYWLMVADVRAYWRALRGVLVRVANHFPELPSWARYETPGCLKSLGLTLPCTESDVKEAYRQLAQQLHPDRGGDRQKFLHLQRQLEEALTFLRAHETEFRSK